MFLKDPTDGNAFDL